MTRYESPVMGDVSFQNNVCDPLLSGKEFAAVQIPTGEIEGKFLGDIFGKEVTVEQLPISKRIAGALFRRKRSLGLPEPERSLYHFQTGGSRTEDRVGE